jgi:glycosyltransferase involved in cell wall biosynthesis
VALITVVIPTLQHRHAELQRALDSLAAQTCQDFEVWVMPNGPDRRLQDVIAGSERVGVRALWARSQIRILPLGQPWNIGYGAVNRLVAGYLCQSEFMAYLDDDNFYERAHLAGLLAAIGDHDFAFCQMKRAGEVVFSGAVAVGSIDASVMLHRTAALQKAVYDPNDGYVADGRFAERLVAAGATYVFVPQATLVYPEPRFGR